MIRGITASPRAKAKDFWLFLKKFRLPFLESIALERPMRLFFAINTELKATAAVNSRFI